MIGSISDRFDMKAVSKYDRPISRKFACMVLDLVLIMMAISFVIMITMGFLGNNNGDLILLIYAVIYLVYVASMSFPAMGHVNAILEMEETGQLSDEAASAHGKIVYNICAIATMSYIMVTICLLKLANVDI